ncbi:ImmA/IrrE family metallo-endopeptidase [Shouchella clausii]|uniref:ImmA/IrrE family metallo-endopeptidase n=1 Tax=Shouchella clausii TaxID=79880 RepID=UPI000792E05A|nr:ImmA/IrrE family metallo-endopeptidase [Shouchella clausii]KKI85335.1 membrane protein [Shouchella clausii]
MNYEKLLKETERYEIETYEKPMPPKLKGLYSDNVVLINQNIALTEKTCVLAEELGHYHTASGNLLDQNNLSNRKQEKLARTWAYKKLVPLSKIVQAYEQHIKNLHEMAEFLGVTEKFLKSALLRYKEIYGDKCRFKGFMIYFEPLSIKKL